MLIGMKVPRLGRKGTLMVSKTQKVHRTRKVNKTKVVGKTKEFSSVIMFIAGM